MTGPGTAVGLVKPAHFTLLIERERNRATPTLGGPHRDRDIRICEGGRVDIDGGEDVVIDIGPSCDLLQRGALRAGNVHDLDIGNLNGFLRTFISPYAIRMKSTVEMGRGLLGGSYAT